MASKKSKTASLITENGNKPKIPPHVRKYSKSDGTRANYKENPYNYHKLFRDFVQVKRAYYEDRNRFVTIYEELVEATKDIWEEAVEKGDVDMISRLTNIKTDIASNTYKALDPLTKALMEVRKMAELVEKQIEKDNFHNIPTDTEEASIDDIQKILNS